MPKIKSFAPSWLNEPSPAHKLFEQPADDARIPAALPYGKKQKPGPRRTIARRGTEVFVAVGKQIRWGDLAYLKESWETKHTRAGASPGCDEEHADDDGTEGYRVSWTHQAHPRSVGGIRY
jgi:nucleoporin NUP82